MARYLYLLLILLILIVPFALRRAASARLAPSPADSSAQRLIIITPHNQDICKEFARAFDAWHQKTYRSPVTIDWRNVGGTDDVKRFLQTTFRAQLDPSGSFKPGATAGIDAVWGGGDYFFNRDLKPLNILAPMPDDAAFRKVLHDAIPDPSLAGVNLLDVSKDASGKPLPPQWIGTCLSSFGIIYNPDLYSAHALNLPPPTTWADLGDPRLAGYVALADPTHSGSAAVAYMMVIQRAMADAEAEVFLAQPALKALPKADLAKNPAYQAALAAGFRKGMGQLLLIAANARYFTDSAPRVPNDVGNGEAAAGTTIDFYGRVYEETVGSARCRFVLPKAATAITPDPIALLRGSPHPELARHFLEFIFSAEGQRLWQLKPGTPGGPVERPLRRTPIRRDVYGASAAQRANWSDPETNPFESAGGFNQRGEWMKPFGELKLIWAAAWIDSRNALHDAYGRVLAVPDPKRRAQLIAELADLGFELSDVDALMKEHKSRSDEHRDVEVWYAEKRVELGNRFRGHYRAVEAKARGD